MINLGSYALIYNAFFRGWFVVVHNITISAKLRLHLLGLRARLHEPGLTGNPGAYINPGYKKITFT